MRFLLATKNLRIGDISYEGLPLLLMDDGQPFQPAQSYIWALITENLLPDRKSWEKYGRQLYDYFGYLESNGLKWNVSEIGEDSPVIKYRGWKLRRGQERSTINHALGTICRFYKWAVEKELITDVPFGYREILIDHHFSQHHLDHVKDKGRTISVPDVTLKDAKKKPRVLGLDQIKLCLSSLPNKTHRLMFELMVSSGLRSEECRTFPIAYLSDPSKNLSFRAMKEKGLNPWIPVQLDPSSGMLLKNDKARKIYLPYDLMEELFWYAQVKYRPARERNADSERFELFLTEDGNRYSDSSMQSIFERLSGRAGFHVHAHMLRHTYATHTLRFLKGNKSFKGDALAFVQGTLGHEDLATTQIYTDTVNDLEGELILRHETEINKILRSAREFFTE